MNPSTALATVLVDEWVRCGVREVVLSPGSRSAPLAYAVRAAERAGRLRLHVRVDERSAAFLALGLAKVSRRPAVVVTTSGTAVANLHPAVLEAHHAGVPLLVCSADRPAELRGTGANQTTQQPGIFAAAVRWSHDLPPAQGLSGEQASWRALVCRAVAAATGVGGDPGPVHLNVALRDPLTPDADPQWHEPLAGRPGGEPWVVLPVRAGGASASPLRLPARTLVLLGDLPDPGDAAGVLAAAARAGWPVVAEPFGTSDRTGVLPHGPMVLLDETFLQGHLPDLVLTVGRLTLSRETAPLLRHPEVTVHQVSALAQWTDPSHVVRRVHRLEELLEAGADVLDPSWGSAWVAAGERLAARVRGVTPGARTESAPAGEGMSEEPPTGPGVARIVAAAVPDGGTLVLGSSNAPRDLDLADDGAPRGVRTVVANRGLAGIDGTVSTAVGVALAQAGPTLALMGDLTFLHDLNGLLMGPVEPRPDLTLVVVNDDGGGIFATLEYGAPERATDFERLFATPTGADLGALCRGHGVAHELVTGLLDLQQALQRPTRGLRVLEVPVDRAAHRALRAALRQAAAG